MSRCPSDANSLSFTLNVILHAQKQDLESYPNLNFLKCTVTADARVLHRLAARLYACYIDRNRIKEWHACGNVITLRQYHNNWLVRRTSDQAAGTWDNDILHSLTSVQVALISLPWVLLVADLSLPSWPEVLASPIGFLRTCVSTVSASHSTAPAQFSLLSVIKPFGELYRSARKPIRRKLALSPSRFNAVTQL